MIYQVEFHPKAQTELEEAYFWYAQRSEGLGKRFLTAIEVRLNEISMNPDIASKKKRQIL